jgi:sterol desaturase/sphingolipid hydroxylase (fatty acid hydroxylase superfamily)
MPATEMTDRLLYAAAGLLAVVVLLFGIERLVPLRGRTRELWARVFVNLVASALAFATAGVVVKPATAAVLHWTADRPFGFLYLGNLPAPARAAFGILLMDLSFYYWHLANHRVPLLWRFHNVHHIDPDLDVTTAFRFHVGEVALSAVFRVAQVSLIGMSLGVYAAYEIVFHANTAFHHSDVRLPIRLERLLNKLLVTPRMHGIHHSQVRGETNSNYGVVFPWWDRLHRTLGLNVPQADIVVGVPGYIRPEDNRLWNMLRDAVSPAARLLATAGRHGGHAGSRRPPGELGALGGVNVSRPVS